MKKLCYGLERGREGEEGRQESMYPDVVQMNNNLLIDDNDDA